MWVIKGTLFGLVILIAGLIAYVLYSVFTWASPLPSNAQVDIRVFISWPVVWLALVGSVVVCCVIFKFLPGFLRR